MKKAITFLILFIFFHFSGWAQTWTFTPVSGTNYTPNSALFVTATIDAGEGGYDGTLTCVGCVSGSATCVTSGRNITCTTDAQDFFVTPASGAVVFTARATKNNKTTYDDVAIYLESPLPIELTFFNAFLEGNEVQLTWSTATETNNEYFMVQHSTNGRDFSDIVILIGAGTTTREHSYNYQHKTPSPGTNYYRLKQVDYDGAFTISPVRVVEMNGSSSTSDNWSIQPTIASNQVYLLRHAEAIAANWTVYTMDGRPTLQGNIPTDGDLQAIEISTLHSGPYFLQVTSSEGVWSGRLVKE